MRFLVYTHHNDGIHEGASFREVGELSAPSKAAYAARHGYDFLCQTVFPPSVAPCFERIYMALEHLDHYDWLFYTDADAMIMNPEVRLEDLIDERYDLITTENTSSSRPVETNNGVMLIKCSEWSRALLKRIDTPHYHSQPMLSQQALNDFYREPETAARIRLTPWRFFNSLWHSQYSADNWQSGDFVLHAAGGGNLWRKTLFTELAPQVAAGNLITINTPPAR